MPDRDKNEGAEFGALDYFIATVITVAAVFAIIYGLTVFLTS